MQRPRGDERARRAFRRKTRPKKRAFGRRNGHSAELPDHANGVGGRHKMTLQRSDRSVSHQCAHVGGADAGGCRNLPCGKHLGYGGTERRHLSLRQRQKPCRGSGGLKIPFVDIFGRYSEVLLPRLPPGCARGVTARPLLMLAKGPASAVESFDRYGKDSLRRSRHEREG